MRLTGSAAIVTGAGRGIGEAIARAFAREGCRLMLAARTSSELEGLAVELRRSGADVKTCVADVTADDEVDRLVREAVTEYGAIDVLVNNAGTYGPIGPFAETNIDDWRRALDVNLGGTLRCSRLVIPHMIAAGHGKIVNLSGGGATSPLPNLSAYAVSKTAIVRLTETLAEELREHNIHVNAIAPGMVDTRLQDDLLKAGTRAGADLFGRVRKIRTTGEGGVAPTIAAELAVFLASGESNRLTGKLISAPHDPWREWNGRGDELSATPMYTLRRLDPFTLRPLKDRI